MINILFAGGSMKDGIHVGNYMFGKCGDVVLYAEKVAPANIDENAAEVYGYDALKEEILEQAKAAGISEDQLVFVD